MRCKQVQRKLDVFTSDDLAPQVRTRVEEHLRSCERCRVAVERLRKLAGVLEAAPGAPLPAGFAERLMQKARRRSVVATAARFSLNPLHWWQENPVAVRIAVAASLIVGLALGGLLGSDTWSAAAQEKPAADPVAVYSLDYLSAAPDGSVAQAFSSMISAPRKVGE